MYYYDTNGVVTTYDNSNGTKCIDGPTLTEGTHYHVVIESGKIYKYYECKDPSHYEKNN